MPLCTRRMQFRLVKARRTSFRLYLNSDHEWDRYATRFYMRFGYMEATIGIGTMRDFLICLSVESAALISSFLETIRNFSPLVLFSFSIEFICKSMFYAKLLKKRSQFSNYMFEFIVRILLLSIRSLQLDWVSERANIIVYFFNTCKQWSRICSLCDSRVACAAQTIAYMHKG